MAGKLLKSLTSVAETILQEYVEADGTIRCGNKLITAEEAASAGGLLPPLLWHCNMFSDSILNPPEADSDDRPDEGRVEGHSALAEALKRLSGDGEAESFKVKRLEMPKLEFCADPDALTGYSLTNVTMKASDSPATFMFSYFLRFEFLPPLRYEPELLNEVVSGFKDWAEEHVAVADLVEYAPK